MKSAVNAKTIYTSADNRDTLYLADNGLHIRDVVIDAGIEQEVVIGHLSDIHYNYCNLRDFDEADPVLMSTLQHRRWLAGGASVPITRRCLEFLKDADQLVLNGDTLDYLSYGTMELMQREIWDQYPGVIATVGGHESARKMQGTVPESLSREERLATVEYFWKHNIYYVSRLLHGKVLVVGLFNDLASFTAEQQKKLAADIAAARENGWILLLFAHEPIATGNPVHRHITGEDVIMQGDPSAFPNNYCDGDLAGGKNSDTETMSVYQLIVNSADVIKGFFAGHVHSHLYLDIAAKLPDGTSTVIPQYIHASTAYQEGHLMRILIR